MGDKLEEIVIGTIAAVCLILVIAGTVAAIKESATWNEFKQKHRCKITEKVPGEVVPIFGADGKTSFSTVPSKAAWLCDDGITYWR